MLDHLKEEGQVVLVVNDTYMDIDVMCDAIVQSGINAKEIRRCTFGPKDKGDFATIQLELETNGPENIAIGDEIYEQIEDADVLFIHFCPVSEKLLEKAKHLKLIMTNRGGVEHINVPAASKRNIPVVNCIRNAEAVCEFAIGLMIDLSRDISLANRSLHEGGWQREFYNTSFQRTLSNSKVGLIGLGNVGCLLARKLLALGVEVLAYDAFTDEEMLKKKRISEVKLCKDVDDLLKEADFVSLHLRLVKETENWFDMDKIRKMKKTAYLLNTARGGILDYDDLRIALKERIIAGAALDVFDHEPPVEDDPLKQMDNVIMTSHLGGTTLDSFGLSPYLAAKDVTAIIEEDVTERIVNLKQITI